MRENYRNSIASVNKFPQFTTMNVIDGQAGLIICASLIFYSLTIDNILNIIVLLILAGISISMLTGENGLLGQATRAKESTGVAEITEKIDLAVSSAIIAGRGELTQANFEAELTTNFGVKDTDWSLDTSVSPWIVTVHTSNVGDVTRQVTGTTGIATVTPTPTPALATLEIPAGLEEGDTITWTPTGGTYTWYADYYASDNSTYSDQYLASGTAYTNLSASDKENYEDMTISSWKVLSIDTTNNIVKIVPAKSTRGNTGPKSGNVYLQGAQGYNNGVKLLNDACSALYGDEDNGITAKSINIEDIEGIADSDEIETAQSDSGYGIYTLLESYKSYPQLWAQEEGSYINYVDNTSTSTGTLGISQSPTQFIGRTNQTEGKGIVGALDATNNIRPKKTYYYAELADLLDSKYSSIIGLDDCYWVASRFIGGLNDCDAHFGVRIVDEDELCGDYIFGSADLAVEYGRGLFPVVTLSSGVLSQSGSGYTFSVGLRWK